MCLRRLRSHFKMDKISTRLSEQISFLNSLENFTDFILKIFEIFLEFLESKKTLHEISLIKANSVTPKITPHTLETLLNVISDISRMIAKPKIVHDCLLNAGLDAERSKQFTLIWRQQANEVVEKLKKNSFSDNETLENVHWKLSVQTECSEIKQQNFPFIEMNLLFKNHDLSFNLNDQQLTNLYNTLETIQSKLDSLHQTST